MQISLKTLVAISVLVLSPAANATWMFAQSFEPDTGYDTPAFMWQDAPPLGAQRVYFAALSVNADTDVNPNVGALQTQIEVPSDEFHEALFGVWVDCNGDGYVGMLETAVREYNANLLLDDSTCPAVSGSIQKWTAGAHNYNNLVTELIPIARQPSPRDVRLYQDDSARVWGDYHRPDERPTHRSCALNPQPRGTYQSTGGAMNYVDCRFDILGPMNQAFALAGDPLGWSFANEDDARTGALGQIETFGTEDTANSPAYVWDCDGDQLFRSGDMLNESGVGEITADETGGGPTHDIALWGVSPALGNTQDPTVPALYNHTTEGLEGDDNGEDGDGCDTSNDRGADFYGGILGEADFNGVDPNNKIEADWNFGFVTGNRGGAPVSLLGALGGSGNAGMNENDAGLLWGGSRWVSDSAWLSKPGPGTLKIDLANGGVELAPGYWLTFYAYAGSATRDRGLAFPGGEGTYGQWHCGDSTSGVHNGWNCDADAWYINPDGSAIPDPDGELVRPGQAYYFRDVDCYDGSIGETGVGVQPAFYGPEPCE